MTESEKIDRRAAQRIADALRDLSYGSIEVTVHDGRIVEIERREKQRMEIPVTEPATTERSNT